MKKVLMFYGENCPHCHAMMPLVDKLSKEEKIKFEKLEVWHSDKNAEKMRKFAPIIIDCCGGDLGIPAFVDEEKKRAICGELSYDEFKTWLKKK